MPPCRRIAAGDGRLEPPLGELPSGRVTLSDGWIRVYKAKAGG
jgi:hypothetical protein